jgi:hypothetical protein
MEFLTGADGLWDPRLGDADDNRTSPEGRGWKNLALTTALDFNYLSAAIAFLTLIVLPALLVGLVPPIVAAYGQHSVGAAALVTRRPVVALAALALVLALAYAFARPLLTKVVDSLWHLHYTLVFPMFVAVRELICVAAESFPNRSMTPEELGRRRRLGTILAAVLLAGGGILLAISLTFSTDAALLQPRTLQPVTLALAALSNAGVVLGVSTALSSTYWFWHEITSRDVVLDWKPAEASADTTPALRVAHLSDLHMVGEPYGYRMETGTSGPQGNERIRRALRALVEIHSRTPLDRILVTGDITDAGTRAEWVEFVELLGAFPELRRRLLFVPGNHDVNVVDRTNTGRLDVPWSVGHALRKLRVVHALDAVQGRHVQIVDHKTGAPGPSLHDYLRSDDRLTDLRALAERGTWRGRWQISQVWERIFPLVAPPTSDSGYGVVLLDSNARRYFSLTNAIGVVGRSQLQALIAILRSRPRRAWMVLVHHHIVEYPIRSLGLQERVGVALVNAPDVVKGIASCGSPIVVLHGHRHRAWIGRRGAVEVCSAPSMLFGAKGCDTSRGSFHIYDLAARGESGLRLAASEQVSVV